MQVPAGWSQSSYGTDRYARTAACGHRIVDRLAERARHIASGGQRLDAGHGQRAGQQRGVAVGQHGVHSDRRAHLLAGADHQGRAGDRGVGDAPIALPVPEAACRLTNAGRPLAWA